ncbi:MAG: DUF2024 family protein [Mariprofundaceae bacterium]
MNIHVYDTYAQSKNNNIIHFDVFITEQNEQKALIIARNWLISIGEDGSKLTQERCRFCHTQSANTEVELSIQNDGYYILQMEGCPRKL